MLFNDDALAHSYSVWFFEAMSQYTEVEELDANFPFNICLCSRPVMSANDWTLLLQLPSRGNKLE